MTVVNVVKIIIPSSDVACLVSFNLHQTIYPRKSLDELLSTGSE